MSDWRAYMADWSQHDEAKNIMDMARCGHSTLRALLKDCSTEFGPAEGFVYIVGIGQPYTTHIKIGFTKNNPFARLSELQTGNPFRIGMLGYVVGTRDYERHLHDAVWSFRTVGEWFAYDEEVQELVGRVLSERVF